MKPYILAACLSLSLNATVFADPTAEPGTTRPSSEQSGVRPILGALSDQEVWRQYKARFITEAGRVVDTGNGGISHSEGQGYGMLLAVAANDRATFDRIWDWTRANLMVRDDALLVWRWEPGARPAVSDMNNASDGDLLVAWALTEAAESWNSVSHRTAARRSAVELARKLLLPRTDQGTLILPGISGFSAEDRKDGPIINISYYVFPAIARLAVVAPEFDWEELSRSGTNLVELSRFGPSRLPSEWVSFKDGKVQPAEGFPANFGYNAIRIPLYMALAGIGSADQYEPFLNLWSHRDHTGVPIVDLKSGEASEFLEETGYAAITALIVCAANPKPLPREFWTVQTNENYYPVTLHLLSIIAVRMRYEKCAQE